MRLEIAVADTTFTEKTQGQFVTGHRIGMKMKHHCLVLRRFDQEHQSNALFCSGGSAPLYAPVYIARPESDHLQPDAAMVRGTDVPLDSTVDSWL